MQPSRFEPAARYTVAELEAIARVTLDAIRLADSPETRGLYEYELRGIFEGSKGILEVENGRVGWRPVVEVRFDPDLVRSMLGRWADKSVISRGRVSAEGLERKLKKLKRAGVIDPMLSKEILSSGKQLDAWEFVCEVFTRAELERKGQDGAPLIENKPPVKFNGFAI